MRLLTLGRQGQLSLTKDLIGHIPRYAILSHTWGTDDEEVTFDDLKNGSGTAKTGYGKIQFCADRAQKDGLQHFWVDTCCINKANHAEYAEAIVSMYRWYRDAQKCYAYLVDVSSTDPATSTTAGGGMSSAPERTWEPGFRKSRWFTRGWTLQELLAPPSVEFFSREGTWLGDKNTLERQIHETTEIPVAALRGVPVASFSVEERLRWAAKRQTTREEDQAYCLLGMFNVFMPPIYGEGAHAFVRLRREIDTLSGSPGDSRALARAAPAEPAHPIWHVPLGLTSTFVGRTEELGRLRQKILETNGPPILAILGLGGVGKTRLALELVHQIRSEHGARSTLWVEATNQSTVERDMRIIGQKLGIPGIDDDKADAKNLVRQRLSKDTDQPWILVLDNADDEAIWARRSPSADQSSSLVDLLPQSTQGTIIVTTRSRRVASHLAAKEVVELVTMSPEEARHMFLDALETPALATDDEALSELLEKLACLPLAISQAAAYLNMTQEHLRTYLALLEEPEEEAVKLLSEDFGDRSRYASAHNAVALTWFVSFHQILEHHPVAAIFLAFMACLQEKNIPESLLPDVGSKRDVVDALATLRGYSFVTRQPGGTRTGGEADPGALYDMHRLVHLAARSWLRGAGMLGHWQKTCIIRLTEVFPVRDHRYRDLWQAYMPHAQRLCAENAGLEPSQLLEKMGLCLVVDGKYADAVDAHTAVLRWREARHGGSDHRTLMAHENLGEALNWQGSHAAAKMHLQKAWDGQRAYLDTEGPGNPLMTLRTRGKLALAHYNDGQWREAEGHFHEIIATVSAVLGEEHPEALHSRNCLALICYNQGRLQEAETLQARNFQQTLKLLGDEHPDTLTSMGNLACTYGRLGRSREAEAMQAQELRIRSRVLGAEHPSTLVSMANLAETLKGCGRDGEAEAMQAQELRIRSRVLGAEHPSTLVSMANLAETLKGCGKDGEARELMTSYLDLARKVFGDGHYLTKFGVDFLEKCLDLEPLGR